MYKGEQTRLLLEKTVWEVMVEAAGRLPSSYGWVRKETVNKDGKLKQKYKDVYNLQILATNLEQILYFYIDLLFCGFQSNCKSCFSKFTPLDTVIWLLEEFSGANAVCGIRHNHKYWHRESAWARKKTVGEFINEIMLLTCTDNRCVNHTDKAAATAAALTPVMQDYFDSFIEGIVVLTVCGNYNSGKHEWKQSPTESGVIVCCNLFTNLKFMISQVLSDAQLMQEFDNETNYEGSSSSSNCESDGE